MKDLLIKIKMFLEGQAAASQAASAVRKVEDASKGAAGAQGGLAGAVQGSMGRLAALGALAAGGLLVGITVVTEAFQKFTEVLHASMEAAAESERSALKLNQALANTGQFSRETSKEIQDLATTQQELTNVADETWQESAALLIQYGAAVEDIPQYIEIIEDLAGRMGGDVPGATQAFIGAMNGTRTVLQRMGFDVDENATKQERLAAIMRIAASGAGQLRAETMDLGGGWKSILMACGDFLENLGKLINYGGWLTATFKGLAGAINVVNEAIGNTPDNTARIVKNNSSAKQLTGTLGEAKAAADGAADGFEAAGDSAERSGQKMSDAASKAKSFANALKEANDASIKSAETSGADTDRAVRREEAKINANRFLDDEQKESRIFQLREKAIDDKIAELGNRRREIQGRQHEAVKEAGMADFADQAAQAVKASKEAVVDKLTPGMRYEDVLSMRANPDNAIKNQQDKIDDLISARPHSEGMTAVPESVTAAADAEIAKAQALLAQMKTLAEPMKELLAAQAKADKTSARSTKAHENLNAANQETPKAVKEASDKEENLRIDAINLKADREKKISEFVSQRAVKQAQDDLAAMDALQKKRLAGAETIGRTEKQIRSERLAAEDEYAARRLAKENEIGRLQKENARQLQARADTYEAERLERHRRASDEDKQEEERAARKRKNEEKKSDDAWGGNHAEGRIDGRTQTHFGLGGDVIEHHGEATNGRDSMGLALEKSNLASGPITPPVNSRPAGDGERDDTGSGSGASATKDAAQRIEAGLKEMIAAFGRIARTVDTLKGGVSQDAGRIEAGLQRVSADLRNLASRVDQIR